MSDDKNNISKAVIQGEIGHYQKVKRDKVDFCNICGNRTELTWDHVPPKFCFNDVNVRYNSMMEKVKLNRRQIIGQNGVRYRSICQYCNNTFLGTDYDPEYKKLVDILYNLYITPGEGGQYVVIKGLKINRICRAIVGHFLAARNDYCNSVFEKELREYFLNKNLLPPKNYKLLYYTYIYNTIMIIRDVVPGYFGLNSEYKVPPSMLSCINSFPLAFIITSDCNDTCGLYDMFELCTNNIDDEIDLKIDLLSYLYPNHKCARDPYWPCNINDGETGTSFVLMSDTGHKDSVFSNIRNLKMKQ